MALTANTEAWLRWAKAAVAMAMRVIFRLQRSTAGTADRRPKAAGRSELYAYHPEHDPGSNLDFAQESIVGDSVG
jgi:hypothetical protein